MTENEEYKLLVFNSTHHALEAEGILKEKGYNVMMVPILPEITADCGIAIRLNDEFEEVLGLLIRANIELAGYYKVIKEGLKKRIIRLKV